MNLVKKAFLMVAVVLVGFAAVTVAPVAAYADTGTDWQAVQNDAYTIRAQAQAIQQWAQSVKAMATMIQNSETDPEVVSLASQIVALAAQTEADAAAIMVTADDINYRIDHSEATTLRLSDDIGVMADRIGVMADRILWTELQIGVMADRIVESEYLISYSSLMLSAQIKDTVDTMVNQTYALLSTVAHMQSLLG